MTMQAGEATQVTGNSSTPACKDSIAAALCPISRSWMTLNQIWEKAPNGLAQKRSLTSVKYQHSSQDNEQVTLHLPDFNSSALQNMCRSALVACRERLEVADVLYKLHHAVHLQTHSNKNQQYISAVQRSWPGRLRAVMLSSVFKMSAAWRWLKLSTRAWLLQLSAARMPSALHWASTHQSKACSVDQEKDNDEKVEQVHSSPAAKEFQHPSANSDNRQDS